MHVRAPPPTCVVACHVHAGIDKLVKILEGQQEEQFNAEQYMNLYT
jgi:hypothetical protein